MGAKSSRSELSLKDIVEFGEQKLNDLSDSLKKINLKLDSMQKQINSIDNTQTKLKASVDDQFFSLKKSLNLSSRNDEPKASTMKSTSQTYNNEIHPYRNPSPPKNFNDIRTQNFVGNNYSQNPYNYVYSNPMPPPQHDYYHSKKSYEEEPKNIPIIPQILPPISNPIDEEKKQFLISIQKINIYLIGCKSDMVKYFDLLEENYKFIKEIDTDYRGLKEKLSSQKLIEKPCLAITISPEYSGRIDPVWDSMTGLIMQQTEGNHIIVRLVDKSKGSTNDGNNLYHHGINNIAIPNETLFEIERHGFYTESYPPRPKEIESSQKDILLSKVHRCLQERIENYKKNK